MYESEIRMVLNSPRELELLYRTAVSQGKGSEFAQAIKTCYAAEPDNLMLESWYYRLMMTEARAVEAPSADWKLAAPLAIAGGWAVGLVAAFTDLIKNGSIITMGYWPLAGMVVVLMYLLVKQPRNWKIAAIAAAGVCGVYALSAFMAARPAYFSLFTEQFHYRDLMMLNIPILAWTAVGLGVLGRRSPLIQRFAFLRKSLEVFVAGGIFGAGMFIFTMVAFQLFNVIGVEIPMWMQNFMLGFIPGAVPMLAVALAYHPLLQPAEQTTGRGIGGLVITLMRVLLPVTFLVLIIYICFIPFNFMAAFNNRDVLITYNVMLFAVIALLIGATPVVLAELPACWQKPMRWGILGVAGLVALVSLYAMAAVIYRTVGGGLTINRLAILGWNVINISILVVMAVRQVLHREKWVEGGQQAFSLGMVLYPAWALLILLLGPVLF